MPANILFSALILLLAALLFVFAFALLRTLTFSRRFEPVEPVEPAEVDAEVIAGHLAEALRCQTVINEDGVIAEPQAFYELHKMLERTYPRLHASLRRHTINNFSLVYTWPGKDARLDPVLFLAHLDVVPVDPAGLQEWERPPFSGDVVDGYVWGRGALDIKSQVIALMEAVEGLLREGFWPQRTIFLAFGHDEEASGLQGAARIAGVLQEKGVRLEAVLDEGGMIMEDWLPGMAAPMALIGVAEKGYLTLELTAKGAGGHSSTPPRRSAVGILARALARLEERPMPARLDFLTHIYREAGPTLSFGRQLALANPWLFGRSLRRQLLSQPPTAAAMRTTTAVTLVQGGVKDNILPRKARARVNFRLMPGDSIARVCEHTRRVIDDARVQFEPVEASAWEASPLSPTGSQRYHELVKTIRQTFGNVPAAPTLTLGQTDARYYAPICEHIYRFSPMLLTTDDTARIHAANERIAVEALGTMVQFYTRLMENWAGSQAAGAR